MMKSLIITVQVFTIQRNTLLCLIVETILIGTIYKFVAVSRILLQKGKERAMCIIHVRVQCSDRFSEVLVGDTEHTELTIESIVGTALLEVFDTVLVDDVTVHHSRERNDGDGEQE